MKRLTVSSLSMPPSEPSVCQMKLFVSASSFERAPKSCLVFANSLVWNSLQVPASVEANSS